jgi:hypothetical protein
MATDLLSSIGITAPKPADPAALGNLKEVEEQKEALKGQLKGTSDSIALAISGADLLGLDETYKTQLTDLKKQTDDLAASTNISPDQMEKKRKELDDKFSGLLKTQAASIDKRKLDEAQAAIDAVEARYKELQTDKNISQQLLGKYRDLLDVAKKSKDELKKSLDAAAAASLKKKEGFQDAAAPPPTPAAVIRSPTQILAELQALDFQKEAEDDKEFNAWRFAGRLWRQYARFMAFCFCVVGAILGGIVAANHFVEEAFWGIKLYYFVYGAALFPVSLAFGVAKPPYWYASVAPLFKRDTVEPQTLFQRWFTFENPTVAAEDLRLEAGRTLLRMLCGGVAAGLAAFAIYFRFDQYLKKGG